jgi:hypothetical protein
MPHDCSQERSLKARMKREAATLAEIDRIERGIIDAHLAELEAQIAEGIAAQLRALDPLWRRV